MDPAREVVITGIGLVTPIGIGRQAFWASLLEGRSGVGPITAFDAGQMPVRFGAELRDFDGKQLIKPRKALKVMCRELQTGVAAAGLAVDDAGWQPGQTPPERVGTVYGSEMLYGDIHEFADLYHACQVEGEFSYLRYAEVFPNHMNPLWMLKHLPNMAACHVAIMQDARGPNNTIVSGEVSGLLALIEALRVIDRGEADMMIVGATGTRVGITGWMYRGDINLSHRNDDPTAASRPFDADRDGLVNGEGAAAILVETAAHAKARGATVRARIAGWGTATATQRTVPKLQSAIERSIQQSLARAQLERPQIGHVNAHGLSTVEADQAEARAIRSLLGDTPVTAMKSYFGHLGTGGAIAELAGAVLSLEHDVIPKTLNYETPDPECPIAVVHQTELTGRPPAVVKTSFSNTGQTAAVVLSKESL